MIEKVVIQMMEFLYFPEDKADYIPAAISLFFFVVAAIAAMYFFIKYSKKEEKKWEQRIDFNEDRKNN